MRVLFAALLVAAASATIFPSPPIQFSDSWSYNTEAMDGPDNWGESWPVCSGDQEQSPIDIATEGVVEDMMLSNLEFDLTDVEWRVYSAVSQASGVHVWSPAGAQVDNGTVTYQGVDYDLRQIRIHNRAEHRFDGVEHAFEIEFLFKEWDGHWLSYSILGLEGAENDALNGVPMSEFDGQSEPGNFNWDPSDLIPADTSYVQYDGSLSTPDCSTDVIRIVAWRQTYASAAQISAFVVNGATNGGMSMAQRRPVQALNHRTVKFHQMTNPSSVSSCTAVSRFFEDVDGWNINTASEMEIVRLEHNDGKFVEGNPRDDVEFLPWRFVAKTEFRGDIRHVAGGVLRFRLKACRANEQWGDPTADETGDVVITGHEYELVHRFGNAPSTAHFTQYEVPLTGDQWNRRSLLDGPDAPGVPCTCTSNCGPDDCTADDLEAILGYVRCIGIRGQWDALAPQDTPAWLDDVELCDGPDVVVPCPGEQGPKREQCSGHGNCVAGSCECHWGYEGDDCSTKKKCAVGRFPWPEPIENWKRTDDGLNPLP